MSSFLKKLISGDSAVDNSLPPDSFGVITRRVIKHYAAQPPDELGLKLSNDAEVVEVTPGSLSSKSNIPTHFMIFEVNNMFVEDSRSFFEKCRSSLTLTIKLHSLGAVAELIAKILSYEEKYTGEEVRHVLKLDELMSSNPCFKFLSSDHPLFRRYTRRLQEKREANALIKQRVEEAKEQEQKEILEKLRKAQRESQQVNSDKTALSSAVQPVVSPADVSTHFISVCEGATDAFSTVKDPVDEQKRVTPLSSTPAPPIEQKESVSDSIEVVPTASKEELLALVGLGEVAEEESTPVSYVILPSEEYVLPSGEKAVHALKRRIGPPPTPPTSF